MTKIAIIGIGYWGPNLARNFYSLPEVKVSYICDKNQSRLDKSRKLYPEAKFIVDYQEALNDPEVDAVCIATPPSTHFEIAKAALLGGKHVLVEKPFTSNSKEAEELIKIAEDKKRTLMVDYPFVFSPAVRKIKELIDTGELGQIYYFDSERINLGLLQSDTNVVWDLAPHDFSIMDYLFGDTPTDISAVASKHYSLGTEEMAHIMVRYSNKNNLIAHIHLSWLSPLKLRKILIGGSKKMILYNDIEPTEKVKIYDKGIDIDPEKITPTAPFYRSGDVIIPKLDQTETLKIMAEHFINCVKNNKKPLTDGYSGLRVVKILEKIQESIKQDGKGIKINL